MELRHLRYFIAVAEELNFARAAQRIHIEPSPLSRAIRELEDNLGAQLFERSHKGMRLTWPGKVFLEEAQRILSSIEDARSRVLSAASGYRGHLRIGLADGLAQPRMTTLLARCREEEPEIEIRIVELTVKQLLKHLKHDQIDAGFTLCEDTGAEYPRTPIWRDNPVIVMPVRHPLLSQSRISLHQAMRYPLIMCHPELCSGGHATLSRWFREAKTKPAVAEYVSGHESMLLLVAAGYGIGFAIESQVTLFGRTDVVARPVGDGFSYITTYIVRRNKPLSIQLERFIDRARRIVSTEQHVNQWTTQ